MRRTMPMSIALMCSALMIIPTVCAHVPYFEHGDFTKEKPFKVRRSIEQSIAVYSWLENTNDISDDIDVYTFTVDQPVRIYIEGIVPVCDGHYELFVPWFALVGPGLPDPGQPLPFELLDGYGAIIQENVAPGEHRDTFYEPFGGKWYYTGPILDTNISEAGTYYVYYWDPYQTGGDYVAVLGYKEQFGVIDILRALIYTPLIRRGLELHIPSDKIIPLY